MIEPRTYECVNCTIMSPPYKLLCRRLSSRLQTAGVKGLFLQFEGFLFFFRWRPSDRDVRSVKNCQCLFVFRLQLIYYFVHIIMYRILTELLTPSVISTIGSLVKYVSRTRFEKKKRNIYIFQSCEFNALKSY